MIFMSILLVITFVLTIIYFWLKYNYSYWKHKNVPFIPPKLFVGNLLDVVSFRKCVALSFQDFYSSEIGKNQPILGIYIFHQPALLIRDLELVKKILVKDFNIFNNRHAASDPHSDGVGGYSLFFLKNPLWKQVRNGLSPVFTSGKMKQMFSLVDEIGIELDSYLKTLPVNPETNTICVELKDICGLYTTDVIANIAYGIQVNSLTNPNNEFRRNGKKIFQFTWKRSIEFTTVFFIPQLVSLFRFKVFSKETSEFLRSAVNHILEEREKSGVKRNDLIDMLLQLKASTKFQNNNSTNVVFDGDVLVAQAALFFTAGFETSSSAMSFTLYELSKNPEVQERLRKEIKDVLEKNNGKLDYETISNMEYLNMVFQEILRLYPPLPILDRKCCFADQNETYSLDPLSDYKIPNGMPCYIPIFAIQRDPENFPDPEKFDPERFSPENKHKILPYSYLPFGGGPRSCIAERFGIIQAKIGLVHFLRNHFVRLSSKSHKTMKFEKKALIIQAEGGIYCDIVRDPN